MDIEGEHVLDAQWMVQEVICGLNLTCGSSGIDKRTSTVYMQVPRTRHHVLLVVTNRALYLLENNRRYGNVCQVIALKPAAFQYAVLRASSTGQWCRCTAGVRVVEVVPVRAEARAQGRPIQSLARDDRLEQVGDLDLLLPRVLERGRRPVARLDEQLLARRDRLLELRDLLAREVVVELLVPALLAEDVLVDPL